MGLYQLITSIIHRIHGTLILTLFVLNIKEKLKVDALSPSRPWKNVPLSTRKLDSVACFKHNIWYQMTLALAGQFKQLSHEPEKFMSYDIPFTGKHEPNKLTCSPLCDFIAQLVRALHRHRRGHGFESR